MLSGTSRQCQTRELPPSESSKRMPPARQADRSHKPKSRARVPKLKKDQEQRTPKVLSKLGSHHAAPTSRCSWHDVGAAAPLLLAVPRRPAEALLSAGACSCTSAWHTGALAHQAALHMRTTSALHKWSSMPVKLVCTTSVPCTPSRARLSHTGWLGARPFHAPEPCRCRTVLAMVAAQITCCACVRSPQSLMRMCTVAYPQALTPVCSCAASCRPRVAAHLPLAGKPGRVRGKKRVGPPSPSQSAQPSPALRARAARASHAADTQALTPMILSYCGRRPRARAQRQRATDSDRTQGKQWVSQIRTRRLSRHSP
jgi:hypothetical protein